MDRASERDRDMAGNRLKGTEELGTEGHLGWKRRLGGWKSPEARDGVET